MANTIYQNTVLENKYTSVLTTKLDLQNYMTVDDSLMQEAGMVKKVITKTVTGDVQDLEQGKGNTSTISVTTTTNDYTVGVTQGAFPYFDEEAMADPAVVDAGLEGLAEKMVNSFTSKAAAEWKKATLKQEYATTIDFNTVVDAIAKLNLEDESQLFMLISPNMVAAFRKALKDDLKYSSDFVRTGYIGSVVGVPVYVSKAIEDGAAVIATKEAVKLFLKKNTEMEQDRDMNLRKNTIYARKTALVALVDATKVVYISKSAG